MKLWGWASAHGVVEVGSQKADEGHNCSTHKGQHCWHIS